MDRKSKIFFVILALVLLASMGYTYYETVVLRRFEIFVTEDEIPSYTDIFEEIKDLLSSYVQ